MDVPKHFHLDKAEPLCSHLSPHVLTDLREHKLISENGGFVCLMHLDFSVCVLEGKDPLVGFFQKQPGNLEKDSKMKKFEFHC